MVSTPEGLKNNSPLDMGTPGTLNNPSAKHLLSQFLEILDVTQKIMSADCYPIKKYKFIQTVSDLWSRIHKHRGHRKPNVSVKQALYN